MKERKKKKPNQNFDTVDAVEFAKSKMLGECKSVASICNWWDPPVKKFFPTEVDSICSVYTVPCTGLKCNLPSKIAIWSLNFCNRTQALGIGRIVKQVPKVVITAHDQQNCLKNP